MFIKNFVKKGCIISKYVTIGLKVIQQFTYENQKTDRWPSTDTWGTPDLISSHEEVFPFSITLW